MTADLITELDQVRTEIVSLIDRRSHSPLNVDDNRRYHRLAEREVSLLHLISGRTPAPGSA
jgi:hypothetical protein